MVNQYIERALLRKNRGVYFKKGKWLLHVFFLVFTWLAFSIAPRHNKTVVITSSSATLPALVSMVFFAIFFYIYCLYLIPACFKRGQYRKFWLLLAGLLLAFPAMNVALQHILMHHFPAFNYSGKMTFVQFAKETFGTFISYFLGFTTLLYLMELLEEVRTAKEIQQNSAQLLATEHQMIKTRMDPDFVIRSLDGIVKLSSEKDEDAPDSVIRFSDILRYRLYRSAERRVLLEEELQQLGNLIRFHNSIHEADAFCTLETEGTASEKMIPPLTLINIAEPLLNLYTLGAGWSLLIYLLIEDKEIQVAAELSTTHPQLQEAITHIENNLHSIFGNAASFSLESDGPTKSIRICIPIQNSLIASS